jgi:hypothetical protein
VYETVGQPGTEPVACVPGGTCRLEATYHIGDGTGEETFGWGFDDVIRTDDTDSET